jgi:hypothetical protein
LPSATPTGDATAAADNSLAGLHKTRAAKSGHFLAMLINWNDPLERARLIERVGPAEFSRLAVEHHAASVIATANGFDIRPVHTRFGTLYFVVGTGSSFATLDQAREFARRQ